MFSRILVANRGEIACRVMATARRLGIGTVAVYSDADREALHVRIADQAVHIGEAPAARSYLVGERILDAARRSGADAIHPGYGFLSENAPFAASCTAAGVTFIGPPAAAIEAMGSKARAKAIMAAAGVPLVPGYHGDDQADDVLLRAAGEMGYPVLLKATAGGGGKGMRAVYDAADFHAALAAARREAAANFGDDRMLVEKLLARPRHVEVQVFCDSHGAAVYLAERDCSIQRRHQKVIEEAPAPGLSARLRAAMGEAAVAAARAIDYRGAGTVEFLLDGDGRFYFMEMNTRLQVEHPVTEFITGQDLVEWQLRVAAGLPLPLAQEQIRLSGHAMEARIYAEDPQQNFLPSTGTLHYLRTPAEGPNLRIDTGVEEGSEISPYYDPMIAKLIVHGTTREEARRRLARGLGEFRVAGTASNIPFLYNIATSVGFSDADLDTHFIERHHDELFREYPAQFARDIAGAAITLQAQRAADNLAAGSEPFSPWTDTRGWRMNLRSSQHFEIDCHGGRHRVELTFDGPRTTLTAAGEQHAVAGMLDGDTLYLEVDGHRFRAGLAAAPGAQTLFWEDGAFTFAEHRNEVADHSAAPGSASFAAPMHGTVVAHLVSAGTAVAAGDPVVVIEAMKMEQTLRAPSAGTVDGFHYAPGDLVDRGAALAAFTPADDP